MFDFVKTIVDFEKAIGKINAITSKNKEELDGVAEACREFVCLIGGIPLSEIGKNIDFSIEAQIKSLKKERKRTHSIRQQQIDREIGKLKRMK